MPPSVANQTGTPTASKTLQPPSQSLSTAERPYDTSNTLRLPPLPPLPPTSTSTSTLPTPPLPPLPHPRTQSPLAPTPSEDPSPFEWRTLKKLIVLVLSSLVWKSLTVQTQIRSNQGVETILSCTQYDGHNPYIKEHAVMCLKFLLESNQENQAIVRDLEAKGVVNDANTHDLGVKTRLDEAGRVRVENLNMNNLRPPNINIPVSGGGLPPLARAGRGGPSIGAGERARRMARRASESNAAAELLGERFARLDLDRRGGNRVEEVDDDDDDDDDDEVDDEREGEGERFEGADDGDDFDFM